MDILDRARKMVRGLGPEEPTRPQFYSVACPLGHVMRGPRAEGYQALRCPACGAGVFVLPRSPLPEPPVPAAKRVRAATPFDHAQDEPIALSDPPAGEETDAEIEWVEAEELPVEAPPPAPAFDVDSLIAASPKTAAPTPRPSARPKPVATAVPVIVLAEGPSFRERLYKRRHPLMVVGVMVLVAATVFGRAWRERRQNLPRVAESARIDGVEALAHGEFSVAKAKLAQAAAAFEELRDEKGPQIRQLADEAAILADLAGKSLEEILDEAAYKPEDWESRFDTFYKGRSVVIDARVLKAAEGNSPATLDYAIIGEGRSPKLGEVDLAGFKLFEAAPPKAGDAVSFGARLSGVSLGDRGIWRFRLAPTSGVPMVHQEALDRLPGWAEPEVGP